MLDNDIRRSFLIPIPVMLRVLKIEAYCFIGRFRQGEKPNPTPGNWNNIMAPNGEAGYTIWMTSENNGLQRQIPARVVQMSFKIYPSGNEEESWSLSFTFLR